MREELFVSDTSLPKAYHRALMLLHDWGERVYCMDWNTETKECSMTINVKFPLAEPMISKLFIGGAKELQQYKMEMLDGIMDFEICAGNWTYTYHDRIARQYNYVINELKRNPSSRRAVISVWDSSVDKHIGDPPCLNHIQYMIRNKKLYCDVLFRSNDACKATFMNMFALIMLQKQIADELGVEMGEYTHKALSFHCYQRDYAMLDGYAKRIKNATDNHRENELAYCYEGDWKEMMEESEPEILSAVNELRKREELRYQKHRGAYLI